MFWKYFRKHTVGICPACLILFKDANYITLFYFTLGLKSYPQYELAQRQCTGVSGMISFYFKGGSAEVNRFVKNLKLFTLAVSLGSTESLVCIP